MNPKIAEILKNIHKSFYVASVPGQSTKHAQVSASALKTFEDPKKQAPQSYVKLASTVARP